ncbi:MAG: hypothetical protein ACLT4D_13970 [Blautia faecis]
MINKFEKENETIIEDAIEEAIERHKERIKQIDEQVRNEKYALAQLFVSYKIKKELINSYYKEKEVEEDGKRFNEKEKECEERIKDYEEEKDLLKEEQGRLQEWLSKINHYEK